MTVFYIVDFGNQFEFQNIYLIRTEFIIAKPNLFKLVARNLASARASAIKIKILLQTAFLSGGVEEEDVIVNFQIYAF